MRTRPRWTLRSSRQLRRMTRWPCPAARTTHSRSSRRRWRPTRPPSRRRSRQGSPSPTKRRRVASGPMTVPVADPDEALSTRLRDLALVELDALTASAAAPADLVAAYADDVADALREARTRITALRATLGGADPLSVLELAPRQRASDAGAAGAD